MTPKQTLVPALQKEQRHTQGMGGEEGPCCMASGDARNKSEGDTTTVETKQRRVTEAM